MKAAKAPAGYHVQISVFVKLENGVDQDLVWTTPMALSPAYHKAPKWAAKDMADRKVKGRSKILKLAVIAQLVRGAYKP